MPRTSITDFSNFLSDRLGSPVIDKTGIQSHFAVSLVYSNNENDTTRPSVFTVIQEKMGLRLQSTKGPVEVIVIDHIDKAPSEN